MQMNPKSEEWSNMVSESPKQPDGTEIWFTGYGQEYDVFVVSSHLGWNDGPNSHKQETHNMNVFSYCFMC